MTVSTAKTDEPTWFGELLEHPYLSVDDRIDPLLLYAIALQESRRFAEDSDGYIKPWPWVLRTDTQGPEYHGSRSAAEASLRLHLAAGRSVDVGIAQIHIPTHEERVDDPVQLLEPSENFRVAAEILAEALESTSDTVLGIGRYHSWDEERARDYGKSVLRMYNALRNGDISNAD